MPPLTSDEFLRRYNLLQKNLSLPFDSAANANTERDPELAAIRSLLALRNFQEQSGPVTQPCVEAVTENPHALKRSRENPRRSLVKPPQLVASRTSNSDCDLFSYRFFLSEIRYIAPPFRLYVKYSPSSSSVKSRGAGASETGPTSSATLIASDSARHSLASFFEISPSFVLPTFRIPSLLEWLQKFSFAVHQFVQSSDSSLSTLGSAVTMVAWCQEKFRCYEDGLLALEEQYKQVCFVVRNHVSLVILLFFRTFYFL